MTSCSSAVSQCYWHRIKSCSVSFARYAPRWKRRNVSMARRSRKSRTRLFAKRMKLLPHCKSNSKHSVIPTVLKSRRSQRSATHSKRSSRGLGVIVSSHDHSSLNHVTTLVSILLFNQFQERLSATDLHLYSVTFMLRIMYRTRLMTQLRQSSQVVQVRMQGRVVVLAA